MAGLIPFNNRKSIFSNRFDGFSNMLDDFFSDMLPARFFGADTFKIDVSEDDKSYLVEAELPGVKKSEIKLVLREGHLNIAIEREENKEDKRSNYIHKERRSSSMSRSVYLADIDEKAVDASFEEGILKVTLAKAPHEEGYKRIDIK